MYSQKAWGGPVEPFISINFIKSSPKSTGDPVVGLVVYEWRDEDLIGVSPSPDATEASPLKYMSHGEANTKSNAEKMDM